ncbi:hypothetical protein SVIOM342S_06902 [Streptomyces violaceorubidus]
MGLAHEVPRLGSVPSAVLPFARLTRVGLAQRRHRLLHRGERREHVTLPRAPVLDHVLPPALGVVVSGGRGEGGERITPDVGGHGAGPVARVPAVRPVVRRPPRQRVRGREVDEAGRDVVFQGPADGHPLRGELGQRPERRVAGLVHGVGEERDRRPHALVGGQRIRASASGGPSTSTTPGRTASSAARTARADPGPWWRTPSSSGRPPGPPAPRGPPDPPLPARSAPVTPSPSPAGPARVPVVTRRTGHRRTRPSSARPHPRAVHAVTSRQAR